MRYMIVAVAGLMIAGPVMAEETVACDSTCPEGKKIVSYSDGNSATCLCMAEGQMDETVPDLSEREGDNET